MSFPFSISFWHVMFAITNVPENRRRQCYSGYFFISYTPVSLSYSMRSSGMFPSLSELINTGDYCTVTWPGNESLYPIPTGARSQMLAGVSGFSVQCERGTSVIKSRRRVWWKCFWSRKPQKDTKDICYKMLNGLLVSFLFLWSLLR